MLSDHERKTLLDVERRFIAEDPEFARSFDDQLHQRPAAPHGSNGKIAVAVALLFSAILLLAGFPGARSPASSRPQCSARCGGARKGSDPSGTPQAGDRGRAEVPQAPRRPHRQASATPLLGGLRAVVHALPRPSANGAVGLHSALEHDQRLLGPAALATGPLG